MSYLKAFHDAKKHVRITGDVILVERLEEREVTTTGGIVIPKDDVMKHSARVSVSEGLPTFVRVLSIGEGYYDPETKETVPLDVEVGDIVLVGGHSVQWFSRFGDMNLSGKDTYKIGITLENQIKARFNGEEGYKAFFDTLNEGL